MLTRGSSHEEVLYYFNTTLFGTSKYQYILEDLAMSALSIYLFSLI